MAIQKSLFLVILITLVNACSDFEPESKFSCEGEINLDSQVFPQKWQLIKMTGNTLNSETTGVKMAWQEFILLNSDNTFVKNRNQNNQSTEASGTYNFEIVGNDQSFQLNLLYNSENPLVGNCFGDPKLETYILTTKCSLVGTWSWCDGPGLEYQKNEQGN